jgi:isocitrate dehydrogenase kinase/phosphatase
MTSMTTAFPADSAQPEINWCAEALFQRFVDYNDAFHDITRRARDRFETRSWAAGQQDAVDRIDLYDGRVTACADELSARFPGRITDPAIWVTLKRIYAARIAQQPDSEFFMTFFNSVSRRIFKTVGVNPMVEFIRSDIGSASRAGGLPLRVYPIKGDPTATVRQILIDFRFAIPYANFERTIDFTAGEILQGGNGIPIDSIELLSTIFYRDSRAYLVGRLVRATRIAPIAIALKNTGSGIVVDAVILSDADTSMLFGYSRSYFHADLDCVGPVVGFLRTVMPRKPIDELYTVLGRAKQGKTERVHRLYDHLATVPDRFVHADGDRGMVMIVFNLPSYDLVFKVIRDRFAYPKNSSRAQVIAKYQLVFKHDRVGRLVDAQEFRRLRFHRSRFSPDLLADLRQDASQSCRLEGEDLVIEHCYTERRTRPLNLYLREVDEEAARAAIIDYGNAIRDLANTNIFPGDLLVKNFGVSRHGRVMFYDYDELCFITDCNFRPIPEAPYDADEMRDEPWYYVHPNDVFPEQFPRFLGLPQKWVEVFQAHHAELLDPAYWEKIKNLHLSGRIIDVVPYAFRFGHQPQRATSASQYADD